MARFVPLVVMMEDGRPARPAGRGRPASIVKDSALTESEGIRQGLEDAKKGRTRPAREFFAKFEARHDILPFVFAYSSTLSFRAEQDRPLADGLVKSRDLVFGGAQQHSPNCKSVAEANSRSFDSRNELARESVSSARDDRIKSESVLSCSWPLSKPNFSRLSTWRPGIHMTKQG